MIKKKKSAKMLKGGVFALSNFWKTVAGKGSGKEGE